MAITDAQIVATIKTLMRDSPTNNRLIADYEFSDAEVLIATAVAIADYNDLPPHVINLAASTLELADLFRIRYGVMAVLYEMLRDLQYRNQLSYDDGDFNVNLSEKGNTYAQLAESTKQKFRRDCILYKEQVNVHNLLTDIL